MGNFNPWVAATDLRKAYYSLIISFRDESSLLLANETAEEAFHCPLPAGRNCYLLLYTSFFICSLICVCFM